MTTDIGFIRSCLFNDADTAAELKQVAYSARDTAALFGIPEHRVWTLLRRGELKARHTNRQYLISGTILLKIRPSADINDPHMVIDPDKAYRLSDLATLFGVSYGIAHRLGRNRIKPDRQMGVRPLFYGRTILAFLDGADEPLRSPAA